MFRYFLFELISFKRYTLTYFASFQPTSFYKSSYICFVKTFCKQNKYATMKISTYFVLNDRHKSKSELCSISLRIGYNRKYAFQDTGIEILANQFDSKTAKKGQWSVVKKHPRQDMYNQQLKALMDKVFEISHELKMSDESFTARTIKSRIKTVGEKAVSVFYRILKEDRSIKINTKKAISSMITRLSEFSPDILINEIDYQFAKRFESWLLSRPSRYNATLSINTTNKYLRDLSRMLTRSIKYEIIDNNRLIGYDFIKEPRQPKKTKHLTFDDLQTIEQVDLSEFFTGQKLQSVEYTKDAFLFACYTGLRISDLLTVAPNHYKDRILVVDTKKGEETVLLPIKDLFKGKPYKLFKSYSQLRIGSKPLFGDKKRVTHQSNIGIIRAVLFPKRKVSFHTARHTFDTLLSELGVDPHTRQRLLGHKKVETTMNVYDHHGWSKEHNEIKQKFG